MWIAFFSHKILRWLAFLPKCSENNVLIGMSINVSAFLSIARILATLGIFIFHLLGLYGMNNRWIDFVSISIFCFLSGYLSFSINYQRKNLIWIYSKIASIMIPYWFVIIPVLILNRLYSYKETSLLSDFLSFCGFSLFLENPVYVISWYITFIVMIYIFIYIQHFFSNFYAKIAIWIIGFIYFGSFLLMPYYFLFFSLGFFLSKIINPPDKKIIENNWLGKILYSLQDTCFAFFLVHGGILLLLTVEFRMTIYSTFIWGILLSGIGAIVVRRITKHLTVKVLQGFGA